MGNKINVFVDGSAYSPVVCDYAAWLASSDDQIELVHLLEDKDKAESNLSGAIGLGARTNILTQLAKLDEERAKLEMAHGREILADAKARVSAGTGANVTENLRRGDLVESIKVLDADADLFMIGKRGEDHQAGSSPIGSNIEALVRASTKPVFIANRAFTKPQNFIVAFDGGDSSTRALQKLEAMPVGSDALPITILVVKDGVRDVSAQAQSHQTRIQATGRSASLLVQTGQREEEIVKAVSQIEAPVLVMGAYGHSRIRRWFIGSTTTNMIQQCKVPLLLFR